MENITEEWARNAPAGAELDRAVQIFMGTDGVLKKIDNRKPVRRRKMARSWSTSQVSFLEMLKAIGPSRVHIEFDDMFDAPSWQVLVGGFGIVVAANCPILAIARAIAVLVARGITREDIEGGER